MSTLKSKKNDVSDIIDRMIKATGSKNQAELLRYLGKSASTAAQWRSRKSIPQDTIAIVALKTNTSAHWLETGIGQGIKEDQTEYNNIDQAAVTETIELIKKVEKLISKNLDPQRFAEVFIKIYSAKVAQEHVEIEDFINMITSR